MGGGDVGEDGQPTEPLPSITFLLLGLDDEVVELPDTILVGHFNGENAELDIISIPRDSNVVITPELRADFAAIGRPQSLNSIIINELFTRSGSRTASGHGLRFMSDYLENLLNVTFDYYVMVDLVAFRYIVDAVGGIYMVAGDSMKLDQCFCYVHIFNL